MPEIDLVVFKEAAASNAWAAIFPELTLGLLALGLLALELILPKSRYDLIPRIALLGQVVLLVLMLFPAPGGSFTGEETFGGMLYHSGYGDAFRVLFLLTSIMVTWMGINSLERQTLPRVEFFHIVLVATAAMMLLVQSNHFAMLFVALETVTVCFYVLVSYFRHTVHSLEAGLKYLILGALSSAMLTFGIVLLYGTAGNPQLPGSTQEPMNFLNLRLFLEVNPGNVVAIIGMLLVLCGVAFKIGAFPFQIWIPDVYQGAPTPVTAFLAVGSKAAGFAVLARLVTSVFPPLNDVLVPVLTAATAATILFGNIAALTQRNTKRLMGLSGVSHAGYLLLGVLAAVSVDWAVGAVVFYLYVYMIASMAVFGVLNHLADTEDAGLETDDFADLGEKHPMLGAVLSIGLGSLAGIPPLAGFIGKVLIFVAAFKAGLYGLLGVAIVGVILSIYYYFGWMKLAMFRFTRVVPEDVQVKAL
ncbi:MAG: NADH-quinone oxidoreductase subunit N, partial [Verrucomicrobia bacterium]